MNLYFHDLAVYRLPSEKYDIERSRMVEKFLAQSTGAIFLRLPSKSINYD